MHRVCVVQNTQASVIIGYTNIHNSVIMPLFPSLPRDIHRYNEHDIDIAPSSGI